MKTENLYGTCCPSCKNGEVVIIDIDEPFYWGYSTDTWHYSKINYCPFCGYELPDPSIDKAPNGLSDGE